MATQAAKPKPKAPASTSASTIFIPASEYVEPVYAATSSSQSQGVNPYTFDDPTSALSAALMSRRSQAMQRNPYLLTARNLAQVPFYNEEADPWENVAAQLVQGLLMGGLESYGRYDVNQDLAPVMQGYSDILSGAKDPSAALSLDPEYGPVIMASMMREKSAKDRKLQELQGKIAETVAIKSVEGMTERGQIPTSFSMTPTKAGYTFDFGGGTQAAPSVSISEDAQELQNIYNENLQFGKDAAEEAVKQAREDRSERTKADRDIEATQFETMQKSLVEGAQKAGDKLGKAKTLESAADNFSGAFGGKLTGVGAYVEEGLDALQSLIPNSVGDAAEARRQSRQAIEGTISGIARGERVAGEGTMSETDMALLQKQAKLSATNAESLKNVASALQIAAKRDTVKPDLASSWFKARGTIDGFNEAWASYVDANPIFSSSGNKLTVSESSSSDPKTFFSPLLKSPASKPGGAPRLEEIDFSPEALSKITAPDPETIKMMISQESGGNPNAISPKGAMGTMQLMPGTAREVMLEVGLTPPKTDEELKTLLTKNPVLNARLGAFYFGKQLKAFGNNETKALASYNAGPKPVKEYGGVPPYPETQKYTKSIEAKKAKGDDATANVHTFAGHSYKFDPQTLKYQKIG